MRYKKSPLFCACLLALVSCLIESEAAFGQTVAEDCARLRSLRSQAIANSIVQIGNGIVVGLAAGQKNGTTTVAVGTLNQVAALQAGALVAQETKTVTARLGITDTQSRKKVCNF